MSTVAKKKVFLKQRLSTSERWAKHALIMLYNKQTDDEQMTQQTVHANDVGFSGLDAEILSSFAVQLEARGFLSGKQMALLYKKMPKYWRQVLNMCDQSKLESLIQ